VRVHETYRVIAATHFILTLLPGPMAGYQSDPNIDGGLVVFDRTIKGKSTAVLELATMIDQGVRIFEFVKITYLFQ
jgi:hypothetical protein